MTDASFVGIDVSKAKLDVCYLPEGRQFVVPNTRAGWEDLVERLSQVGSVGCLVVEATGGLEMPVCAELALHEIPVSIVNPRQARDFAKATGRLAKTDAIDSRVLAHFAQAIRPKATVLPDEQAQELAALMARRRQLIGMLTAEQNRLGSERVPSVQKRLNRHISWLERELGRDDKALETFIKASPLWKAKEDLLRGVPGVGPVLARTLIADLPQIGSLNRKEVAALVGVAPLNSDSGAWRGQRHTWGGRGRVRTALYMGALVATRYNPIIRAFYQGLLARGKPKKVALVACMRKLLTILNAMVKAETEWQPAGS